jgi:hypothetical protein
MNRLNIKFVPKCLNPPAVPQLGPIESFWTIYKRAIYEKGWSANTPEELQKRATKVLRKFKPELWQNLLKGVKKRFRRVTREGLSALND